MLPGVMQDEGAPFAVVEGGGEGSGGDPKELATLLRLLEKREPLFLVEEDEGGGGDGGVEGGADGGGAGEGCGVGGGDLDSFLFMPSASDISVVSVGGAAGSVPRRSMWGSRSVCASRSMWE
jgi:hypothetical protein